MWILVFQLDKALQATKPGRQLYFHYLHDMLTMGEFTSRKPFPGRHLLRPAASIVCLVNTKSASTPQAGGEFIATLRLRAGELIAPLVASWFWLRQSDAEFAN